MRTNDPPMYKDPRSIDPPVIINTHNPVCIAVPIEGSSPETKLINALESVMNQLSKQPDPSDSVNASHKQRAADWLQSKYGTPR